MANGLLYREIALKLEPAGGYGYARVGTKPITLAPNLGQVPRGSVLGYINSGANAGCYTPRVVANLTNPSVAPTLTDTGSAGGTWQRTGNVWVAYTLVDANGGETLPSPATICAIAATTDEALTTALGTLPTGAVSVNWYSSTGVGDEELRLYANGTGAAIGIKHEAPAENKGIPFTNTSNLVTNGAGTADCLLQDDVYVDSSGNMFFGTFTGSPISPVSLPALTVTGIIAGPFLVSQLVGYDANVPAEMGASLKAGGSVLLIPA